MRSWGVVAVFRSESTAWSENEAKEQLLLYPNDHSAIDLINFHCLLQLRRTMAKVNVDKGERVTVEKVELNLELDDDEQEQFEENPKEVIREALEDAGQEVREIYVDREVKKPSQMRRPYHIAYPADEKSGWIII